MKEDFNYYHGCKTFLAWAKTLHAKKWELISRNFKNILIYMLRTSHNDDYWTLSPQNKIAFHMP